MGIIQDPTSNFQYGMTGFYQAAATRCISTQCVLSGKGKDKRACQKHFQEKTFTQVWQTPQKSMVCPCPVMSDTTWTLQTTLGHAIVGDIYMHAIVLESFCVIVVSLQYSHSRMTNLRIPTRNHSKAVPTYSTSATLNLNHNTLDFFSHSSHICTLTCIYVYNFVYITIFQCQEKLKLQVSIKFFVSLLDKLNTSNLRNF